MWLHGGRNGSRLSRQHPMRHDWDNDGSESDDWDDDPSVEGDFDEEWPDDEDADSLTVPCPSCGADIYEDAEQCPVCGEYVVRTSTAWQGKPIWWILLGGLGILATILGLSLG